VIIHPEGEAVFVEVPKTGSTAVTIFLQKQHQWVQNGSGLSIDNTMLGRHGWLSTEQRDMYASHGVPIFGVCRNPFERASSLWRGHAPGSTSFTEWLKTGRFQHGNVEIKTTPQTFWLQGCTDVLRYEHLTEDWAAAVAKYPGVLPPLPDGGLPRVNVSKKTQKPEWDEWQLEWVRKTFAVDIAFGGYSGPA